MEIRYYRPGDLESILLLFQNTIFTVNAKDYPPEQLNAWAASALDHEQWATRLEDNITLVAEADGDIIGFGELTEAGVIHTLYVHKAHQRKGIARRLLSELEYWALCWEFPCLQTDASITARAFFLSQGFRLLSQQQKSVNGQQMVNFQMEKVLE